MKPTFFKTQPDFRKWFERHHATAKELLVGFYKKGSGKPSITWPLESVDEALCFGWIDGIRRSSTTSAIRFGSRRADRSVYGAAVNIKRAQELIDRGLDEAGRTLRHFRLDENTDRASILTNSEVKHSLSLTKEVFKRNKRAWAFFQAQSPWYRKTVGWWIVSAKKEETRHKRLARLMEDSAQRTNDARVESDEGDELSFELDSNVWSVIDKSWISIL